jgi:PAS domain S-box-containing protein
LDYIFLLILGFIDVIVLVIAVLTIALTGAIYWIITRRHNTGLQEFFIDTLINEHDQAIALLSSSGKIVLTNKGFDDLVGLKSSDVKGKKLQQIVLKPDLLEALLKSDDKINENGASQVSYNYRIRKFKTDVWLNIQKRTILQKKSEKKYVLLLITDISEKKKVEKRLFNAQIEYQQLVESAYDIIYRTDIAGNLIYTNAAITNILGYDSNFLRKLNIKNIVVEEDAERLVQFFTQKLNEVNGEDYIEFRVEALDGSHYWLGQKTSLITLGDEIIGLQSVARDFTARIKAENELHRAKEIAEKASEAKSNFISSLSHEFRTPLNAILGYSQILERNKGILPDEKGHISEIKNAGEKLLSMVDDILELSNLEARHSKAHEERMLLRPYLDNYANRYSKLASSKGLEFNYRFDTTATEYVVTDFTRLSLVLKNVLDNAIKFTEEGSVDLSYAVVTELQKSSLLITIKDSGIGFPENHINDVFQPFWQLDPIKNSGTGLGLTLSERIVQFLNGEITFQNNEEGGVFVTISIPIEVVQKSTEQKISLSGTNDQKIEIHRSGETKILIVDDLLPNRTITRIILHENGFVYKEAENGQEAVSMIEDFDPDVILMDINMPVMDGIEAMLKIRSTSWKYKKMPIIAVTAGAMGGRTELLEQGFTDYLQKPFKEAELLGVINKALDEKLSSLFEKDKVEVSLEDYSPKDVANFIHSLDIKTNKSIQNIIENEYLERLSETYLLNRYPTIVFTKAIQKLISATEEYDYIYLAEVVKHLKEFAEIKPE